MMERWKGARLAHKEKEKIELNALLANTGTIKFFFAFANT